MKTVGHNEVNVSYVFFLLCAFDKIKKKNFDLGVAGIWYTSAHAYQT